MKKLSKDSQQKLALVGLVTAIVIAGIWFGLISSQKNTLQKLENEKLAAERQLHEVENTISNGERVHLELSTAAEELSAIEEGIASGDPYIWMIDTIRQFKLPYKVEIRSFGNITVGNTSIAPTFPYQQGTLSISGSGYYHEIGKFLSDLENEFPHIRLQNLLIEKLPIVVEDRESLFFKVEVVALIKPRTT